jgi:hypothetical protein
MFMAEEKLPGFRRVIGVPQKREEITAILSECYARDLLSLEDYEHRIGLVHDASTLDELETFISDVPADILAAVKNGRPVATPAGSGAVITVNHGVRTIEDQRLAVRSLEFSAKGGVIKLRYTELTDLPPVMDIRAELAGSVLKIIVPPEIEVAEDMENTGSVIKYKRGRLFRGTQVKARLRITGTARGSVVKIVTRRSWFQWIRWFTDR